MKIVNKLLEGLYSTAMIGGKLVSEHYNGNTEWFTKAYLNDITLPFGLYFLGKLLTTESKHRELFFASYTFLCCSAFETLQGLGLYKGTFDPRDFIAYAAGTSLAFALDKLTLRKDDPNFEN
ncbi:MAG: hypothetical protein J4469_01220 [Candidatus Aenigmarchaeota archaeon]|nr:hypothetical protein [Candidatus Aenigmarchaeota archaeon]